MAEDTISLSNRGTGGSDGPRIAGYRDFKPLGQGGFAIVFSAYQEQFDRVVAVKVLTINLDEKARERFIRECRAAGRLSAHPNVVTVLDAGLTDDGRPYMTTELMARGSIADWIDRNGPMPLADALQVGVKMCGALNVVHAAGILHRDIKPQNILVSAYGEPALADFGISAVGMGTDGARATMTFTPEYTPPEILEGKPPDPTMDVYSLGATIYALLTGLPPFVSREDEGLLPFIRRIMHDPVPPLPDDIAPPEVVDVLATAMAKDPAGRFPSTEVFGQRLQELQASLGQPVTPMLTTSDSGGVDPTAGIESLLRTTGTGSIMAATAVPSGPATGRSGGPWIAVAAVVVVLGLLAALVLTRRGSDAVAAGPGSTAGPGGPAGPSGPSGPGPSGPGGTPTFNPAPATQGGRLRVALRDDIGDLRIGSTDANPSVMAVLTSITDPLVRYTEKGPEGFLAESVTPNADATEWTITVRAGARFSDGSPVDGRAVADSMALLRANPVVAAFAQPIKTVDVTGDRTVVVRLTAPWAGFPGLLAQGLGLVLKKSDAGPPIGCGPFKIKDLGKANEVVLVRNENYWGERPFLDEIDFVVTTGDDQRATALEKGEVDAVFISDSNTVSRLATRFPAVVEDQAFLHYLVFNTANAPFKDDRVRDALAGSIDRKVLAATLGERAEPSSAALALAPLAAESKAPRPLDQAKARRALAELKRGGLALDFTLDAALNSGAAEVAQGLKKMWEGAGFRDAFAIEVKAIEPKKLSQEQVTGTYAAVVATITSPPDPDLFYPFLHSGSPLNLSKLSDPKIDALLADGRSAADLDARRAAYTNLATRLEETNGYVFLVSEPYALVLSPRVTGARADMGRELVRGGAVPWASKLGIEH